MPRKEDKADEIIRTTLRIPRSLWERAKHQAIADRVSLQDMFNQALAEYLKKGGQS
jgi:predicted HicB family RNase H-like nuclease